MLDSFCSTLINIPYHAFITDLATTYDSRTRLIGYCRSMGVVGLSGGVVIQSIMLSLVGSGDDDKKSFIFAAGVVSIILIICAFTVFFTSKNVVPVAVIKNGDDGDDDINKINNRINKSDNNNNNTNNNNNNNDSSDKYMNKNNNINLNNDNSNSSSYGSIGSGNPNSNSSNKILSFGEKFGTLLYKTKSEMKETYKSKNFRIVCYIYICSGLSGSAIQTSIVLFIKYSLKADDEFSNLMMVWALSVIGNIIFWGKMCQIYEKRTCMIVGSVCGFILQASSGWYMNKDTLWFTYIAFILSGIVFGVGNINIYI
jgi:Na+/melibiose symporter-like transporter